MIHTLDSLLKYELCRRRYVVTRASLLEMRIDLRQTVDLSRGIPRVDQTAASGLGEISEILTTIYRQLEECAGAVDVVQCCVATDSVVVVDGGNESTAIAVQRISLEREEAETRMEEGLYTMYSSQYFLRACR